MPLGWSTINTNKKKSGVNYRIRVYLILVINVLSFGAVSTKYKLKAYITQIYQQTFESYQVPNLLKVTEGHRPQSQ